MKCSGILGKKRLCVHFRNKSLVAFFLVRVLFSPTSKQKLTNSVLVRRSCRRSSLHSIFPWDNDRSIDILALSEKHLITIKQIKFAFSELRLNVINCIPQHFLNILNSSHILHIIRVSKKFQISKFSFKNRTSWKFFFFLMRLKSCSVQF